MKRILLLFTLIAFLTCFVSCGSHESDYFDPGQSFLLELNKEGPYEKNGIVLQIERNERGYSAHFIEPEVLSLVSVMYSEGYANICEIGKERIRRAGKKIKAEHPEAKDLDIGFRVLRLDSSNMEDVYYTPDMFDPTTLTGLLDNVKSDRTEEDLLFQVMLELDIPLSASIVVEQLAGKRVFNVSDGHLIATFDKDVVKTVQFQLGTSTQTSDDTSNAASATISGISAGSYNLGVTLELKKQVTASALNSALGMTLTLSAGADHYGSTLYNVSTSPVTFTERGTTAADMIDALSDINDLQEDQNGTYYGGTDGHHYYLVESTDGNDPAIRIDGSEGDNGITDLNSEFSVVLNIPDGVNFCVNLRFSDGWAILGDDNTITVKLTVIEGSSPRTYQTTITDAGNYYIYVKENNNGTKTLVADTTKGYMSGNGNDVAFQASGERGNQFIASNTLEVKLVFQN